MLWGKNVNGDPAHCHNKRRGTAVHPDQARLTPRAQTARSDPYVESVLGLRVSRSHAPRAQERPAGDPGEDDDDCGRGAFCDAVVVSATAEGERQSRWFE